MAFKKRTTLAEQAAAENQPVVKIGIDYDDWKYEDGIDSKSPAHIREQWIRQYKANQAAVMVQIENAVKKPLF